MNFRRNTRSKPATLQMSSLMDVVFLLLCFFVTTSLFSQWESEVSIKLPTASTSQIPTRMPGELILNLSEEGGVRLNGRDLSLEQVTKNLERIVGQYRNQPVIIRADKMVSYDKLMGLIDACRKAGVWNFSLATQDLGSGKTNVETK